jgi:N-methylhydantoinase A
MTGRDDPLADGGADLRVGVDIGGTFTDVIGFDPESGTYHTCKVSSTPSAPSEGVINGLEQLFAETDFEPGDLTVLSHGSTVTVNALIERTGAKTGLLLTEGFDAVPVAGRGSRPQSEVKNPRYEPPEPLVPPRRVADVPERVDSDGNVVKELDEAATREAIRDLREQGVEAIAVGLLFSFLNPDHERRVADLIEEEHPDCAVSLSSDISPRIREYPRLSTTTVNAYIDRKLGDYLDRLESSLAGIDVEPDELTMMLSHGGLASFAEATQTASHTLLSGPAAGVQGALFAADLAESAEETTSRADDGAAGPDVVTMDMGGTSCDVAIAPESQPIETTESEFGGNPVSIPMVDISAIGAGGGTLARAEGGRLQIGPESAGADPGPVSYGRGGEIPTVTDANAILGRLNPEAILGGDLEIAIERTREALAEKVADPLEMSVDEAAAGILRVVNDKMKKELSLTLTRNGHDPRDFSLVAYGGAGPMHAAAIARELSIGRVVVPPFPGINSAVGLQTTDRKRLFERSAVERLTEADLDAGFAPLEEQAAAAAEEAGIDEAERTFVRELELRYAGQSYELTIGVDGDDDAAALREKFDAAHEEAYGHAGEEPLETMTYRIRLEADAPKLTGDLLRLDDGGGDDWGPTDAREVFFDGEFVETPVYWRDDLPAGATFYGPAIVEQLDTTTVVEPDMEATVDEYGNLILEARQ